MLKDKRHLFRSINIQNNYGKLQKNPMFSVRLIFTKNPSIIESSRAIKSDAVDWNN